ncbi:hypothetical protein AV530_017232 [Patagioenas fasciata monilis]|uniref:KIAA0232 n=1 Tax=Patagioenas fasciata monilis TaxID=372326 RepID=A0A1V4JF86_PATFA|nr:hypothetical protein AV530_017232 [Patagioenas fasciata monilis]
MVMDQLFPKCLPKGDQNRLGCPGSVPPASLGDGSSGTGSAASSGCQRPQGPALRRHGRSCWGLASGLNVKLSSSSSYPGPESVSEMSLLHALGPVQTWLGQELEKCGIDAMIYTRYVLSLLLHDSYDYDLQEQENDIFLGWEKGAYKKWGKSKKKCSDLTLEEMKKQAAVQCLRSASDESSGIETLVEELCSRLKDLQSKQEEKIHKKLEGSLSPETDLSPTAKDQVEMYYEAFPPLSEKPVCLQEIMTVWNKSKDCNSESEVTKDRSNKASATVQERTQQKKSKNEKENKFSNNTVEEKPVLYKKQVRHKSEGKMRPRSWSSGSSEAGSSSSGNQDSRNEKEYKEEPLWYTEPITEYFVPLSRKSKLETTYRNREDICGVTSEAVEELSESVHGLCISNNNIHKTYLAAEDDKYLDDVHLSELTHFYEVDIDQSMLDPGASETMQGESRILNMIRQKMFEVQCSNSVLPFSFETLNLGNENADSSSTANILGKTQSRLLIWTKNSAFDENEHCSNLSTRTCSPWSHSEETRSDNETLNIPYEESTQFNAEDMNYVVPRVSSSYVDEEILDFLPEETCQQQARTLGEMPTLIFKKKSKLESVCGIQLEQKAESKDYETTQGCSENSPHGDGYSSGVIKDIWTNMTDRNSAAMVEIEGIEDELFSTDVNNYCCCLDTEAKVETLQEPNKAVQRSEYHLWEGQKENLEKRAFVSNDLSKVDGGDYTTPSKPWDVNQDKENSFILGGVYGELKTFNSDGEWAVVPPGHSKGSLLQCAASDVVTIAGTDVFMTPGNSFAPGHRQLWRPFVSFEQNEQSKSGDNGLNKGFSFIFHEDLLGACGNFQVEEPGLEYSFSSFDLNNPFSQVLHVECSFEPEGIASFSPSFKPKSILCSDSDSEVLHPRICGVDRTQYRAIRISPRTHFRPISASELSPGGGSESEFESEKDEGGIAVSSQVDVFEDPQADLKPLEEDAEKEGHYYGKSELESGKFLPRLKKSGMEKSAQTSLDSQEESAGMLPVGNQDPCLECSMKESLEGRAMESSKVNCRIVEPREETARFCSCKAGCHFPTYEDNPVSSGELEERMSGSQEKQCWWEKALYSPLFPASQCEECYTNAKGENGVGEFADAKEISNDDEHLLDFNMVSSVYEARCADDINAEAKPNGFRKKIYSSDSSGSAETASEGGSEWADPCEEELFSRTQL